MTVGSKVKKTLAAMKNIQAMLYQYVQTVQHPEAKPIFERQIPRVDFVIRQLEQRIQQLEREEPQYKGY